MEAISRYELRTRLDAEFMLGTHATMRHERDGFEVQERTKLHI
ncbi:uncharacterized protein G2W53_029604 [Senna tora]|uniref:Uncharacterized protein n=1 Tax=Senna tora TaxID=362788 RepID=A0A834T513_9FABA|nr:uncharacterized protein G2W53_029604 [Senna tora]